MAGLAQAETAATKDGPIVPLMPYVATSHPWARLWLVLSGPAIAANLLLMPPVRRGPTRPEAMSRRPGQRAGLREKKNRRSQGRAMDNTRPRNNCPAILGGIRLRAMSGPKRCGAVMQAPRIPANHPDAPLVVAEQDYRDNCAAIGTTGQGGGQDIAGKATRWSPGWSSRVTVLPARSTAAPPALLSCSRLSSPDQLLSLHTTLPMASATLSRPSESKPRSGSGKAEDGTTPRSSARAAVTRRLP